MKSISRAICMFLLINLMIFSAGIIPAAAAPLPVPTPLPTITGVLPPGGIPTGGTTVIITGSGFTEVTGPNGVKFGGVNANSYTVDSDTRITAKSPVHVPGALDIIVTSLVGSSPIGPEGRYTYYLADPERPSPAITSVNPSAGIPAGGTTVVITGSGFFGVTEPNGVKFGELNAVSYTVDSNTQITAKTPAHALGIVDIVATSPVGSSPFVPEDRYIYTTSPIITSVNPSTGVPDGGTTVVIIGSGFTGVTGSNGVKFGELNATSYTVDSDTRITALSPAHASGIVDIVVTNPLGSSPTVPEDHYTYFLATPPVTLLPAITNVNPSEGVPAGGTTVVITGSGFTGVTGPTGVKFGGVNANSYTVDSDTRITAISPAHAAETVDIVVTSPVGSSPIVPEDQYTYFLAFTAATAPAITRLNPTLGSAVGNTTVVITGSGFTGVTGPNGVKFGELNATSYTVDSDTQITAISPAHAAGTVDVVVTNPLGSSPIVPEDRYTYFLTPTTGDYFNPYIFPSPAKGNTAGIAYYMAGPGLVKIRVYNEIGDLVDTLEESKLAGTHSSSINIGNLSPGVYFCLLDLNYDDGNTKKYSKVKFAVIH